MVQIEKRAKIQQQLSELQLKSIKNQIDPHFTFNTINAINSLIYKEDRDTAYHLTSKFSNLIRSSLENSDKITTTLKEEIEFITNWLDLQRFRFSNRFDYEIDIAEGVDTAMQVPRNILQTYVENAVKHGLKHQEKDGSLKINILQINKYLQISITDNGIGRKAAREKSGFSTGKGLGIMEQIFKLYEKLYNISITQEIIDLYNDNGNPSGTQVVVKVPLPS